MPQSETNKSFCSLLWRHVDVTYDDYVTPCCRFTWWRQDQRYSTRESPIMEIVNNSFFRDIRKRMLEGSPVDGCNKCYEQEEVGIKSLRQNANQRTGPLAGLGETIQSNEVAFLELFLGNECNLKCRMCSPQFSTKWYADFRQLGLELPFGGKTSRGSSRGLEELLKNVQHLKLLGGEPMLIDHSEILASAFGDRIARDVTLYYSTNGTIWPAEQLLDYWRKAKKIDLSISVDGIDRVNHYIRYPTDWSVLNDNVDRYIDLAREMGHLELTISCTGNAYNFMNLKKLSDWYGGKATTAKSKAVVFKFEIIPLVYSSYLSAQILPPFYKEKIRRELSTSPQFDFTSTIAFMMNKDTSELMNAFKRFTKDLDRVRGQNVIESIPELAEVFGV